MDYRDSLRTGEIAAIFLVSSRTVANWIDEDRLPGFRLPGGERRVTREDLIHFARTNPSFHFAVSKLRPHLVVLSDSGELVESLRKAARPLGLLVESADNLFHLGRLVERLNPRCYVLDYRLSGPIVEYARRKICVPNRHQTVVCLDPTGRRGIKATLPGEILSHFAVQ